MRNILAIFLIIGSFAFTAAAQSEGDLTKYFQGKQVTFRIDMPATKHGVNVYPERSQSLDYKEYKERLRTHGVSIHRGEIGTITKVKIKDKNIEVQLADRQLAISRFHIHYTQVESWMLSPLSLIDALNRYVEFTASDKASARHRQPSAFPAGYVRRGVVHLGPRSTYLREGLKKQEVLKLLGEPSLVSERTEGGKVITTYEFPRSEGRILIAEFIGDSLVGSRTDIQPTGSVALLNTGAPQARRPGTGSVSGVSPATRRPPR